MNGSNPVRFATRVLTAVSMIAGVIPTVMDAFDVYTFTADQLNAYTLLVGTLVAAIAVMFGVSVPKRVTPMVNPRDDAGRPLTPGTIGSDDPDTLPPMNPGI